MTRKGHTKSEEYGMSQADTTSTPLMLRIDAAADMLGMPPRLVGQLVRRGELPKVKVGTAYYIPAQAVRDYAAAIAKGQSA